MSTSSKALPPRTLRKRKLPTPESTSDDMLWKKARLSAAAATAAGIAKANELITPDSTSEKDVEDVVPVKGRDPDFGTSTSIKYYYEGKGSQCGHYNWVEKPPKQLSEKVVKANTSVAIKLFKIKDYEQPTIAGKTPLKIHEVELQSPVLVAALKPILRDADMHIEASEPAKFMEPFKPLFFSYDKIMELHARTKKDGLLKQHLGLLVTVMEELFGGFLSHLKNLNKSGLISYKLAWTYFPKGTMVYCAERDCERVCRILSTAYEMGQCNRMALNCEEMSFDGDVFSWKPLTRYIKPFAGNKPVIDLMSYPLSFHDDPDSVKKRLTTRAIKKLDYQELTYCEYTGVAIQVGQCGVERHNVDGRILIDYFGYKKHHEGFQRNGNPQPANSARSGRRSTSNKVPDTVDQATYVHTLSKEQQERNKEDMLSRPDELVCFSPYLEGFALKNKLWFYFYIDDIKPVVWNDDAYGHLVYPEEQKDLVLTFVDNHQRLKTKVDDVIMGKGQGLILLLSGPPGTGKTLTAEAVADKTRRPLYYLQAEDLGTNAAHLGPKIKKVFEMATEWDAVILLDEADVFMAKRDPGDIARNELVSIFLRELEYFKGIIFLTTNLYSTIDAAFRSRVQLHLVFKSLPPSSRLLLWDKFLSRLDIPNSSGSSTKSTGSNKLTVSAKDLKELAKWELNGREIKNAIKTVRTWCVCKGFEMNLLRLESGIKVTAPQAQKMEEVVE